MMYLVGALLWLALQAMLPPTRSLDQGPRSGISSPHQVAVRDAEAWKALWGEHAGGRPLPAVDFDREMVAGVFSGTKPTAGFSVEIVGYRETGADVVVYFRETGPRPGAITAQVLSSPYHLAAIPRHPGSVTFEKTGS